AGQPFRGKLCATVERERRFVGKIFGYPCGRDSANCLAASIRLKSVAVCYHFQLAERGDGIDAASAQKDKAGPASLAIFQQIDCATKIMLDYLPATGLVVYTCKDARIRRSVDHPVRVRQSINVARAAKLAVTNSDSRPPQRRPIKLASRTDEIVEAKNLRVLRSFPQG